MVSTTTIRCRATIFFSPPVDDTMSQKITTKIQKNGWREEEGSKNTQTIEQHIKNNKKPKRIFQNSSDTRKKKNREVDTAHMVTSYFFFI